MMKRKTYYLILFLLFGFLHLHAEINHGLNATTLPANLGIIVQTEPVVVNSPVRTVPQLPYQIWVTYTNGKSAYRQVKWSNSARATEQNQANPSVFPVGMRYEIKGYVLGDNSTKEGYPITAQVTVVKKTYDTPSHQPIAEPLPLDQVTIIGENRLTSNRELAIKEILSWDVTQQLYNYRDTYGLSTEGYKVADGWDSPTTKLKGHGSGHYMSALAFAFASSDDATQKEQLRTNMRRMVSELRSCQERTFVWNDSLGRYWEARDFAPEEELRNMKGTWADFDRYKTEWHKYGYGYLNAIPAQHAVLIEMYRAYNNSDWVWAAYYSIHKQLAGLIDIATYVDDPEIADTAFLIAKDMGLWIWNRLHHRTFVQLEGTQAERRARPGNRYEMWNIYIAGEDGGTGESLARLSEMVNDPTEKARLLEASNYFDSPAFYDPLANNIDDIRTRHANQHIPKITSALRSYRGNKNPYYYNLAENFWQMIQGRYRYATGGVGNGEMFREPYTQILSMATNITSDRERNLHPSPHINETCCVYNLAKLTKDLNAFNPDNAAYMDYYERVLYNQLVGSINHKKYQMTYHYAVGINATKQFGSETPQSTCCGGTGSENHVKYQEAAYFVSDETIWVALYLPTRAKWESKGVTIQQNCTWPAEYSTLEIAAGEAEFEMKLRVPYWATEGFDVKLNDNSIAANYQPGTYVTIPKRRWNQSDRVEIIMPFTKHIDYGPDKLERAATDVNVTNTEFSPMWAGTLMYGPLAMAAPGIKNWEEAQLDIDANLDIISTERSEAAQDGKDALLFKLKVGDLVFTPDYYQHHNMTHYFRINTIESKSDLLRNELLEKLKVVNIYDKRGYSRRSYSQLNKAIKSGNLLYESQRISEEQMAAQKIAIDSAIAGLKSRGIKRNVLQAAVSTAQALEKSKFTFNSFEKMLAVLAEAEQTLTQSSDQKNIDETVYKLQQAQSALVAISEIKTDVLQELITEAEQRKKMQEQWSAMAVKVPDYSPWAPNGFAEMEKVLLQARPVLHFTDKNYSQQEVDAMSAQLNAAINTMRPGNLPELSDLTNLLVLMEKARQINRSKHTEEYLDTIAYAEMVVSYVGDGSGTHDMIENAMKRVQVLLQEIE